MSKIGLNLGNRDKIDVSMEQIKTMFPKKSKSVTHQTVAIINECVNNPEFKGRELMTDMAMYQSVMHKNSGSLSGYIESLKFSALLESDATLPVIEVYARVFHNRQFVIDRRSAPTNSKHYKELASAASRFRKSPMVIGILTMAQVPLHLMFSGESYAAVGVLVDEMSTAKYAKDRIAAAKAVLEHVKPPENARIELDVSINQGSVIDDYNKVIDRLVTAQLAEIEKGGDVKTIANVSILPTEIIDVEPAISTVEEGVPDVYEIY